MSTENTVNSSEDTIPVKRSQIQEAKGDDVQCSTCGSTRFREEGGEVYCRKCGTVVDEDRVDTSKEWRAFNSEEREEKRRVGSPITFTKADKGMGTKIGHNAEMNKVSGRKRTQYYRMRKWDKRLSNSRSRGLQQALKELQRVSSDLNLPESVYEEAARLTEKAQEEGIIQGRGIDATVGALVYLVARKQDVPRTLEEVAEQVPIKKRKLGKAYRHTARELDMQIKPGRPEDFIPRYASQLGLSGEVQAKARGIIQDARNTDALAGRSPTGIVAASLYIATKLEGEKLTQREIADEVGVTSVTVRKNYKDLAESLGIEEELENA
ncbi:transcription initiation factor IIB [Candidatus Nanohalococcus occultus]|uniref:Transcription initiation factor IIB n=1 Tax=Candidatus Nanohalococcus occultus TaxID=2978047 RepID=A0ABY8CE50_9ARCH|nr:Transcription initiation factor TFIIB, Brf1 subunit/Transcription initiation factor TFIIB [Candidatus Nanohaloarchaeota archaeon SVXNc]